jgi:branched-chain amino acid aminotransferase
MLSWSFNLVLLERALAAGYDEVVLLDEHGQVSECTSANIFAVFGERAVTPPLTSGCLPGITRAILLEEIRVPGVEIAEGPLSLADLERADEVFITSSTRDLLPVAAVRDLTIRRGVADGVRARLSVAFANHLNAYASRHARPISLLDRDELKGVSNGSPGLIGGESFAIEASQTN